MTLTEIAALLGGLALFLFGMKMMSDGLEQAAGDKMKRILERLTSNRFAGVAVGAGITAVIQSSSATTVMVVGFVNSPCLSLFFRGFGQFCLPFFDFFIFLSKIAFNTFSFSNDHQSVLQFCAGSENNPLISSHV